MNYILDTHALLWFLRGDNKLSETAYQIILDDASNKFISIASLWEISVKNRIGKLPLKKGVTDIFNKTKNNGFGIIGIDRSCVEIYNTLP